MDGLDNINSTLMADAMSAPNGADMGNPASVPLTVGDTIGEINQDLGVYGPTASQGGPESGFGASAIPSGTSGGANTNPGGSPNIAYGPPIINALANLALGVQGKGAYLGQTSGSSSGPTSYPTATSYGGGYGPSPFGAPAPGIQGVNVQGLMPLFILAIIVVVFISIFEKR